MRLNSIITALLVSVGIYLVVMERDFLMAIAGETEEETAAEAIEDQAPPVSVQVARIMAQEIDSGIVLRGRTEAFRLVTVKAETSGLIVSQPLRKGLLVEEGEALCQLDPGTRNATLAEARARVTEASARVDEANTADSNARALVKRGVATKTSLVSTQAAVDAAQAGLEAAEAGVIRAEKDLDRLSITAPFSGLLESDTAELGELMQPGAPCATIISLDPIKLVGFATEEQIIKLDVGALAGARLVDGREIVGQVTFLSRSADPQTRTYRVEVTAPNKTLAFRDGATAEILIKLSGETGHLIPRSSMTLNDAGELGVRLVEADRAMFAPIEIVRDTAQGVWVSGLPQEANIIVVGQEFVTDGRAVTPVFQDDQS